MEKVQAPMHSVSVRTLAEFAQEKGDLIPGARAVARMREGVRGHQILQEMLPFHWQAEAPLSIDTRVDGFAMRVHGRADAVYVGSDYIGVQEIKTTGKNPSLILKNDYPAHWAQAEIYAWILCKNHHIDRAEVRLTYARLDGQKREYKEEYDVQTLQERFLNYARPYVDWISRVEDWKDRSRPTLNSMHFPFANYREGQREMARQIYRAMKRSSRALIEAPTGIGKTAAALYGALKALGEGSITAIFYLTARTTGRKAAEDALDRMRAQGVAIRSVTITAKEKCCFLDKADCMGCAYASGYYDKRRDALKAAMAMEKLDAESIGELAQRYGLCPFELSLDISENADVIICDYNYAFDPRVRLKRYFDTRSKAGLLVDEVHNLPDRAREMLSAMISGKELGEVRRLVARFEGKESPMYELLTRLLRAFTREDAELECVSDLPRDIVEAVEIFAEAAEEMEPVEPEVVAFCQNAQWFVRVAKQYDATCYRTMIFPEEKRIAVRLWCFDPSKHVGKLFSRVGGAGLFSATLAPMDFYASQLAADGEGDVRLKLESPFPRENLKVCRLPVSVAFKDRERTCHAVAQIIHTMAQAHRGNYLACFPSYAYLNLVYEHYRMRWPGDYVIRQSNAMNESARMAFIECFQPEPARSMVGFIVLGGVFSEGVDLPDDRLSGAAIVSTGIPQIGYEREMMREIYDDAMEGGYDVAYVYPGIRRVLQAAGRVIRTENDRGVVLLLDMRYKQEKYRALMPEHWQVCDVKNLSGLTEKLKTFWKS